MFEGEIWKRVNIENKKESFFNKISQEKIQLQNVYFATCTVTIFLLLLQSEILKKR